MSKALRPTPAEYEKTIQRIKAANAQTKSPQSGFNGPGQEALNPSRTGVGSQKAKKTRQGLKKPGTDCEELMAYQLGQAGIQYDREVIFHPTRRWRFDFVITGQALAVEIDGGRWAPGGGRHGGDPDREKLAEAAIMGYRVIRASPAQVRSGQALEWVERAILSP